MNIARWIGRSRPLVVVGLLGCGGAAVSTAPEPARSPEEAAALARADSIRDALLAASAWVDFSTTGCDTGALRTFPGDSVPAQAQENEQRIRDLERLIIAWGLDTPLDSAAGRSLLATAIAWEADAGRPRWDVPAGANPPVALAAGLGGQFTDMATGECVRVGTDTMAVVLPPALSHVELPRMRAQLITSDSALRALRDRFAAAHANDPQAVLAYVRLRTAVVWNGWGLVSVQRPVEQGGILQLGGAGGASYIFHRVGGEWRLLVIARTWG